MSTHNSGLNLSAGQIRPFITEALKHGHVPYIGGPPGIGKSQIVYQIAEEHNARMIDLRLSQMLSEDLTGLPERNDEKTKARYLPFSTFPLEGDEVPEGKAGWILFLDELSSASEEVLAAVYSLILDRTVGGHRLHPKCRVVAAGNLSSDSAIARDLPDTLTTRMLPVRMKVITRDWLSWARNACPSGTESVVAYIERNPGQLYAPVKAKERAELETYPTPRGWEKVFAYVGSHEEACRQQNPDAQFMDALPDETFFLIASAVGTMAAHAFREDYKTVTELPGTWEICQAPHNTRIPDSELQIARLTEEIVQHFVSSDEEIKGAFSIYLKRLPEENREAFVSRIIEETPKTRGRKAMIDKLRKRLDLPEDLERDSDAKKKQKRTATAKKKA